MSSLASFLSQDLDLTEPLMGNPRWAFSVQYFPVWSLDGPIALLKLAVCSALIPTDHQDAPGCPLWSGPGDFLVERAFCVHSWREAWDSLGLSFF